jgi:hypothetical protein
MQIKSFARPAGLLLVVLMAATAVAGCTTGNGTGSGAGDGSFPSYEEAKNAPGQVYLRTGGEGGAMDLRLKLLEPEDPQNANEGTHTIVILLFDAEADRPLTDAQITLESMMSGMDHGSDGETDPTHKHHGVYQGRTNHVMPGDWAVHIDVVPAEGGEYNFRIDYTVE